MKLIVCSSSSAGNGYVLNSIDESLIIEAGVYKPLFHVAVNPVGCIVSHHHGDHAKYAAQIARRTTIGGTEDTVKDLPSAIVFKEGKTYGFSRFSVTPFSVPHTNADETPCPSFGYLIRHPEMGTLLFATDTFTLPYRFPNVNHFLIEANYQDNILNEQVENGKTSFAQKKRIQLSHMSLHGCIESIRQCGVGKCRSITICHVSSRHANPSEMVHAIQSEFGIPTYIAKKGAEILL